jgi:hypothetical protein
MTRGEFYSCTPGSTLYISALEKELIAEGLTRYEKNNGMICHSNDQLFLMQGAIARTNAYYRGATILILNPEQKSRTISFLEGNAREYKFQKSKAGLEMVVVFSGSNEEFEQTQLVLNCLEKSNEC